ncbi:MFS transporter [Szabonella alba]|uniref:MFS transporter n=1 Tax=Szabonella alba TaxID=2804194 RepID=A0A8K0VEA2_9RHOB|nr:MFS transporter [Szabonella alba]MBL4917515.1 MFS transporter [Szabonella alba]
MRAGGSLGVWLLAVGQTVGFACLFYLFAALILSIHADLGWDRRLLAAGPMLSIGVTALLSPIAGRMVDRGQGRILLIAGPLLGAVALTGLASATLPLVWLASWAVIGIAHAMSLYDVCFAYLVRRYSSDARPRIIKVTLVAGLASTLAFPAGAALAEAYGWRIAVLVAAGAMAFVTLPCHAFGTALVRADTALSDRPRQVGPPPPMLRNPAFLAIAALLVLTGLNHWMLIAFLVPLLTGLGVGLPVAILAASLIGPAQTLGRLFLMTVEARMGNRAALRLMLASLIGASALLLAVGLAPVLVFAFAALQGSAMGILTILRPSLVAETLGQGNFGAINGMLSIPAHASSAFAPVLAAAVLQGAGPYGLVAVCLVLALATIAAARAIRPV